MRGAIFYTGGIAFTSGIFFRSFFDIGGTGVALVLLVGIGCLLAWRIAGHLQNSPLLVFGFVCCLLALGAPDPGPKSRIGTKRRLTLKSGWADNLSAISSKFIIAHFFLKCLF